MTSENPLSKYFRQPQLYFKLPSEGRWYPADALEMPVTKELPVYAMTARDELTLKTPDALLNGQATVDVIQSCIPNIKNAWNIPTVDLDAILIAIRQATFGNQMDFVSVCPHCNHKNDNALDLGFLSSKIQCPDFNETIKIEGLEIFLKPHTYEQLNKSNLENFEQQRILAVVADATLSESDKISKFNAMFKNLLDLTVAQVAKSVAGIKTDDGVLVEDQTYIDDFFKNCNRTIWDAVKLRLEVLAKQNKLSEVDLVCESDECNKPYASPILFEMSNFFV
jgi:hypothetical protein